MAEIKITVEKPADAGDTDIVTVKENEPLVLNVTKDDEAAKAAMWTRGTVEVQTGSTLTIDNITEEDKGIYRATVGDDSDQLAVNVALTPEREEETGAYEQFKPEQLQGVANRLWRVVWFSTAALLAFLFFFGVVAVRSGLIWQVNIGQAQRFPAAFSSVLFITGITVICIGAWLQAAALRVAKLRPEISSEVAGQAKAAGAPLTLPIVGEFFSKIADAVKSLKVPVAAILVGASMVIMSAVTVINTGEGEPCFTIDTADGEPVEIRGAPQPDEAPEGVTFGTCD